MTHSSSALLDIVFRAIADAYIQVSAFVAGTFFLFYGVERWLKIDATEALRDAGNWQVPVSAALGALPGCGGAIIVVTQYVTGRLSFGSVVAVNGNDGRRRLFVTGSRTTDWDWHYLAWLCCWHNQWLAGQRPSRADFYADLAKLRSGSAFEP